LKTILPTITTPIQTLQGQGNPNPAAIYEAAALLSIPSAASAFEIVTENVDAQKYAPLRAVFLSLLDDFRRGKFLREVRRECF